MLLLAAEDGPCPAFVARFLRCGSVLLGGATGADGASVGSITVIVVFVLVDPARLSVNVSDVPRRSTYQLLPTMLTPFASAAR